MKFIKKRSRDVKPPPRLEYKAASAPGNPSEIGQKRKYNEPQQRSQQEGVPHVSKQQEGGVGGERGRGGQVMKKNEKGNDIDDIFSLIKKNKQEAAAPALPVRSKGAAGIKAKESNERLSRAMDSSHGLIKSKHQSIVSPEAPLERIDKATGLPVYKAHLLKVGEGGGTPLCPYDCDCCF